MKTFYVVYRGYVLEVEIVPASEDSGYSHTVGTCASISFFRNGNYIDYSQIIDSFIKNVNQITKNKEDKFVNFSDPSDVELRVLYKGKTLYIGSYDLDKKIVDITKTNFGLKSGTSDKLDELVEQFMQYIDKKEEEEKEFEYKGYTLKLGVVETRKGGYCEELNYKTYGDDEEVNITKFKKYINWKITSDKKEDTSHTHLLTQLDRLAKKDRETNFTPFELRGQLIEIYHLFGKILSLTVQDINKLYFTRAEGEN